jgi:hypothetical protein
MTVTSMSCRPERSVAATNMDKAIPYRIAFLHKILVPQDLNPAGSLLPSLLSANNDKSLYLNAKILYNLFADVIIICFALAYFIR